MLSKCVRDEVNIALGGGDGFETAVEETAGRVEETAGRVEETAMQKRWIRDG